MSDHGFGSTAWLWRMPVTSDGEEYQPCLVCNCEKCFGARARAAAHAALVAISCAITMAMLACTAANACQDADGVVPFRLLDLLGLPRVAP